MSTPNRIRELRKQLGLTQEQLADTAAIGRNTLQRYEASSFRGRIDAETQKRIADALNQPVEAVFSFPSPMASDLSRRQLLASTVSAGLLGVGMTLVPASMIQTVLPGRKQLSSHEVQVLIDDNYATWMLLDTIQQGTTFDYIHAIAQGKLVALGYLARGGLVEQQRRVMLTLLGDMHILIGRLNRDRQNFADAEQHFLTAKEIGEEINNVDLRVAARHRYGNMLLIDQSRLTAAVRNADEMLAESEHASFPVWAEAQLIAGMAYAYIGRYDEARRLGYTARERTGPDPEMWVGALINPKALYADFDLITSLAVQKFHEAYQASADAITIINQEQPETVHWRLNIETMQAQALWGIGDIEGSVNVAAACLECARQMDNPVTITRLEQLYATMVHSRYAKHPGVRRFSDMLFAKQGN